MKKKKKILIISSCICLFVLIGLVLGIIQFKNYQKEQQIKKQHEQLVANTKKQYKYFESNKINEKSDDKTTLIFNQIIKEQEKNEKIDLDTYVKNIDLANLDNTLENINTEIENYNIETLSELDQEHLEKSIPKEYDKQTIIDLYKHNKFIKNLEEEKQKRTDYLTNLNTLKEELTYFKEHQKDITKDNDSFITTNDEVFNKLTEFNNKYKLNLSIKKEEVKITQNVQNTSSGVPILCYHGVLDEPWGIQNLFVRVSEFEAQMKYLADNGYTTLFASQINEANQYDKPVIITFDDGYKDVYTNAFPILKKYNLKANIYIISGWLNGDVYMTTSDLQEMAASPLIEVGSHTVNHKALATLSVSDIEYEMKESQATLQQLTGKKIDVIAYPTGSFDSRVIEIGQKYYKYGLSTIKGKETPGKLNTYSLRRIYVYRGYDVNAFANAF